MGDLLLAGFIGLDGLAPDVAVRVEVDVVLAVGLDDEVAVGVGVFLVLGALPDEVADGGLVDYLDLVAFLELHAPEDREVFLVALAHRGQFVEVLGAPVLDAADDADEVVGMGDLLLAGLVAGAVLDDVDPGIFLA